MMKTRITTEEYARLIWKMSPEILSNLRAVIGLRCRSDEIFDIVPTLSFKIDKRISKACKSHTEILGHLCQSLSYVRHFNWDRNRYLSISNMVKDSDEFYLLEFIDYRCAIVLEKSNTQVKKKNLLPLLKSYLNFRNQSLNIRNLSFDRKSIDWAEFEKKLNLTLIEKTNENLSKEFVSSLSEYATDKYQCSILHCNIIPRKGSLEWDMPDISELVTRDTINETFPFFHSVPSWPISGDLERNSLLRTTPKKINGQYIQIAWIPLYQRDTPSILSDGILIIGTPKVKTFVMENIQYFFSQFFERIRYESRLRAISNPIPQGDELFSHRALKNVSGWSQLYKDFRKDFVSIAQQIINLTNAHSVSLRKYCVKSDKLLLFEDLHTESGAADPQLADDIPVHRGSNTNVVRTFLKAHNGSHHSEIITEDLHRTNSGLRRRPHSRSEFCMKFRVGKVSWGTVNIESPYPAAFDRVTVEFLRSCNMVLQNRAFLHISRFDFKSQVRVIKRDYDMHEALNYIENEIDLANDTRKIIESLLVVSPPLEADHESYTLGSLDLTRKELLIRHCRDEIEDADRMDLISKNFQINFSPSRKKSYLSRERYEIISMIMKNLFTNYASHGLHDSEDFTDTLIIEDSTHRDEFQIRSKMYSVVDADSLQEYGGLIPYNAKSANRVAGIHSGLAITGTLARALGGYFEPLSYGGFHEINIRLPIE